MKKALVIFFGLMFGLTSCRSHRHFNITEDGLIKRTKYDLEEKQFYNRYYVYSVPSKYCQDTTQLKEFAKIIYRAVNYKRHKKYAETIEIKPSVDSLLRFKFSGVSYWERDMQYFFNINDCKIYFTDFIGF